MKKHSKSQHSSLNELNITSLLDLVFVLLVIFIIITLQLSNDLELNLPTAKSRDTNQPPPKLNYILVDPSGSVKLNNQPFTLPVLKQTLIQMKKEDPDTSVVVKGGSDVEYQKVIGVLDILQQADVVKVGLATETAAAPAP